MALHVKTLKKRNPNADVFPVENPFVVEKSFLMRTGFHDVVSYLLKVVSESGSFKTRFDGFNKVDAVFGLKAWKWRPSSYTSLKQKLRASKHLYFNYCTEGDIGELWKEHVKTCQRKIKK